MRLRAQTYLQLVPYVDAASGSFRALQAFAACTFAVFSALFPLACFWALRSDAGAVTRAVTFLRQPLRTSSWAPLWAGPVHYGRKLLFAVLLGSVAAASFAQTLPVLLCASLMGLLAFQVQLGPPRSQTRGREGRALARLRAHMHRVQVVVRPFASAHDNLYEMAILCALLWGYVAMLLRGLTAASSGAARFIEVSTALVELAVVLYGAWQCSAGLRGWLSGQLGLKSGDVRLTGMGERLLADDERPDVSSSSARRSDDAATPSTE
jgi:hypothetical protein